MAITFKAAASHLVSERFVIESKLGSGGFGVVYRAFDQELGSAVALKTLHQTNPRTLFRFKREFRALADITHPNLVTLYELISEDSLWYFTMELVDGVDFLRWVGNGRVLASGGPTAEAAGAATVEIDSGLGADTSELARPETMNTAELRAASGDRRGRCFDEERLRPTLAQLTRGIMALHHMGKLHRDVKPSNVLVDHAGRVRLLDFGMVIDFGGRRSLVEELEHSAEPGRVTFAGTPRYMSPEQAMGEQLDEATDWYAVGVMLYEALTGGQVPVTGDTPLQLLLRKQSADPPAVDQVATDVPGDLAELCMALLNRTPHERPGGADILDLLGEMNATASTQAVRTSATFRRAPFVGRANDLEALRRALTRSIHGDQLSVVNVCGSSGMGKTALVHRFLESLGQEAFSPLVLQGRCYENESVPYKALDSLIDELSSHLYRFSQDEVSTWLAGDVDALTRLFPVLGRAPAIREAVDKCEPAEMDSTTLRTRAFRALRNLLVGLSRKHALVVFIDDVQWGDEDSAILLKALLAPPQPPALFLVMTWRSEDAETSPFLSTFLPALDKLDESLHRLDLSVGELTETEAVELATSLLDERGRQAPERIAAIAREAHGNPFFIDELARHTRMYDTGPDSDLSSLGDVIFRRVTELDPAARRLLEVLAVAGQPVRRQVVRAVAGLEEDEPSALATLRGEHLIRVKSARDYEWLEPYHARIGETLVDRIDHDQLVDYHERLAVTYEAQSHFDPATIARHFLAAGNDEKAGHYSLLAARRAGEALAFERAARLYEQALELRPWPEMRTDILEELGNTYGYLGRGKRAAEAFSQAAELADDTRALDFRIRAAEQLLRGGQFDEGMGALEAVLRQTGFEPPTSTFRTILSVVWKRMRLFQRGFDVEPRPREDIPGATRSRIEALWTAAKMLGAIDPLMGGYYHYHTIHEALDAGSPSHLALAFSQQAAQEAAAGPTPPLAEELLERAERLIEVCDDPEYVRGYVYFLRGFIHYTDGEFADGRRLMRQARQILTDGCTGVIWETTTFQFFEFFPTYWLGRFDVFAAEMPRLLEHAVDRNDVFHMVALRTWRYPAHLAADEPRRAHDDLEQALSDWTRHGYHMQHFWYLQGAVETALYEGNGLNAWSLLAEHRGPLRRSMLLRTEVIERIFWHLTARSAVAALRRTNGLLGRLRLRRAARRALAKLREPRPTHWTKPLADMVEAELHALHGRDQRAIGLLEAAEAGLMEVDLALHARAARRRRGELVGGEEGAELIRSADLWMSERGIANPAAMTAMITGGPRHPRRRLLGK